MQSKVFTKSVKQSRCFFWSSPAFSMIPWMSAISSWVPLPFLNPAWTSGSSQFMYCWSLDWRIYGVYYVMLPVHWFCGEFSHKWMMNYFKSYFCIVSLLYDFLFFNLLMWCTTRVSSYRALGVLGLVSMHWGVGLGPRALGWVDRTVSWTDHGLRVSESSLPANRWGCGPTQLLLGVHYSITGVSRLVGEASSVQFSWVQWLSHVQLFVIPWMAACQASLFITNSWSLLKLKSIELVMPSNYLICCHPLLHPPSIIRVSSLHQVAKYWSFVSSISPSSEYSGLISFRIDW